LLLGAVPAARADQLDRELFKQARQVVRNLADKDYRHVGVLKFLARKGGGSLKANPYTDNVGTLNLQLAHRLEVALLLALDEKTGQKLHFIRDASAVAAGIRGATHLTPAGREALFGHDKYPLYVGSQPVRPDAFLTGFVDIDLPNKEMKISLIAFDRRQNGGFQLAQNGVVKPFTVPLNSALLVESGGSFNLRGLFEGGKVKKVPLNQQQKEDKAVESANEVKTGAAAGPAQDPKAPVQLEVVYYKKQPGDGQRTGEELLARGGRPIKIEAGAGGQFRMEEPNEGEGVLFVLKRNDQSAATYGAVLLVNGENSLFNERQKPPQCTKWILEPGRAQVVVRGFQVDDDRVSDFRVASLKESEREEVKYGADVGTVALVVFRNQTGKAVVNPNPPPKKEEHPADLPDEQQEERIGRGLSFKDTFKKPFPTLESLQQQLEREGKRALKEPSRGLILPGETVKGGVRRVEFTPDPTAVTALTITYYKKR
jgi:hypothetical protein